MGFEKQVVVIYAALNGYFNTVPKDNIRETEARLMEHITKLHEKDVLAPLRETGVLDEKIETKLKEALGNFDFAKL